MDPCDVLIVGGGIAGLATAHGLAREPGDRVVLLEREATLGAGSSGRSAAILRTFGADALTNALGRAAVEFLRRPPAGLASVPLLDACGLVLGASGRAAAALDQALAREGPPCGAERVGRRELGELAPHLRTVPELALHFPAEGRIDVAALLDGLARAARGAGTVIETGCAVSELLSSGSAVEGVRLADGRELRAAVTVLAAGGWAGVLGARAGSRVRLAPTRRHLLVTAPEERVSRRWPVVWLEDAGFYCRPESGGMLLSACDQEAVDPDACVADPRVKEAIAAKATRHLRGFEESRAAHFWCGLRTLTADGRFAVGPDPDLRGLFWVAGLGGHGISTGVEVGRIAAQLLRGRTIDVELARALDPARLGTPGSSLAPG